jgi:Domain of unknown function (DUF2019)
MKKIIPAEMSIDQLLDRYVEIGVAQDDAVFHGKYSKFNRLFDKMREIERELVSRGIEARRTLMRLYDHPNYQVRLNAAKETLAVAPIEARRVIQWIYDSKIYPQFGDAGMCLSNLDDGTFKPE